MNKIKKINWPWVEVDDGFSEGGTVTINMDNISTIWPRVNGHYHYGVRYKDGSWFEFLSKESLEELQELVMTHNTQNYSEFTFPVGVLPVTESLDRAHEDQTMREWLNENGQS